MEFIKEPVKFTKEFIKAGRQIYKLISTNPKVSTIQMADSMGLSTRQVRHRFILNKHPIPYRNKSNK